MKVKMYVGQRNGSDLFFFFLWERSGGGETVSPLNLCTPSACDKQAREHDYHGRTWY